MRTVIGLVLVLGLAACGGGAGGDEAADAADESMSEMAPADTAGMAQDSMMHDSMPGDSMMGDTSMARDTAM